MDEHDAEIPGHAYTLLPCFFCGGDAGAPGHAYTLRHRFWLFIDGLIRMS